MLSKANNDYHLKVLESVYIKSYQPSLSKQKHEFFDCCSVGPLYINCFAHLLKVGGDSSRLLLVTHDLYDST